MGVYVHACVEVRGQRQGLCPWLSTLLSETESLPEPMLADQLVSYGDVSAP